MYNVKKVNEDLYWIGASDRRLALFENIYPIPRGVSYNSYVILDEQTVLLDTVDKSVSGQFFENLEHVLGITATGADLKEARKKAYEATEWVNFANKYMRHDIGKAIDEA